MANVEKTVSGTHRVRWREDGKRRSKTLRTKREAENLRAELEGRDPRDGILFDTLAERWLRAKRTSEGTMTKYRWLLDAMLLPHLSGRRIRGITHAQVVELFNAELDAGRSWDNVRAAKTMLSSMFKSALRDGDASHNPADYRLDKDQRPRRNPTLLTVDQLAGLADGLGHHYRALVLLTAYTGLRWGEATGLFGRHIDLNGMQIAVQQQLVRRRGALVIDDPKTDHSRRIVGLADDVEPEIRSHLNRYRVGRDTFAFTNLEGGPLAANSFFPIWDRARSRLGLDEFRWHDFRHVAASHMLARGIPIQAVSAQLGHASIQITVDLYHHLATDHIDQLRPKLAGLYT